MRIFHDLNVDFMGKRKLFYIFSSVLILIGLVSIFLRGFAFGIDFKGGLEVTLSFKNPVEIAQIRNAASSIGIGNVEVKTFGDQRGVLIRTEVLDMPAELFPRVESKIEGHFTEQFPDTPKKIVEKTSSTIVYAFDSTSVLERVSHSLSLAGFQAVSVPGDSSKTNLSVRVGISDWIKANLSESIKDNPFTVLREERVGPKVGNELKRNALLAVALSLFATLMYLGFRFKFSFAIGAIAALFHDIFITLGLFSIFNGLIPGLNLEISLAVVGAFLTLVGYSLNDTVIVFDRVREYMKIYKTLPLEVVMNKAINRTMSRTVITGLTTLISVIVLLFLGGEVLRGFAFALLIGIITGTYSSIFVASVFVLEYTKRDGKKIEF